MSKDLAYYRLLPYEREWMMREGPEGKYFTVRLKDLPAIAGDGSSRDEAVEDLREAFDEFIVAWTEAGRPIPEPGRAFTVPSEKSDAPAREWSVQTDSARPDSHASRSWVDSAVVYTNHVLVEDSPAEPRMSAVLETAANG